MPNCSPCVRSWAWSLESQLNTLNKYLFCLRAQAMCCRWGVGGARGGPSRGRVNSGRRGRPGAQCLARQPGDMKTSGDASSRGIGKASCHGWCFGGAGPRHDKCGWISGQLWSAVSAVSCELWVLLGPNPRRQCDFAREGLNPPHLRSLTWKVRRGPLAPRVPRFHPHRYE